MIRHRSIFYIISGTLVLISLACFFLWGLKPAIDFTGGSLLEVVYPQGRPSLDVLQIKVDSLGLGNILIQPIGDNGLLLRLRDITEQEHDVLLDVLGQVEQKRFDSIGPVIGKELTRQAVISIILVIIMIILFIAWAFRKVSRPVSSFKYGLAAVIALCHDVIIPVGVFCVLGHFYHIEVDTLFVTALLTILGFSVHDTIVVFDRVRENLRRGANSSFEEMVTQSLWQVCGRSIKTSLAIVLVLLSLFIFGGKTTTYFALTLIIGIISGTYSSLFIASPLLVTWYNWQRKK